MKNNHSPIPAQKVRSVSRRFSYFLIGVVTLIILVFTVIAVLVNSARIDAELERRLDNALKLCNISLTTPLWRLEIDTVDNFINALFLDESIVFAEIEWGGTVVSKRVREKFQKNSATYFEQSSQFIVKTSDILYEGNKIGSMLLAMSREIIKKELLSDILSIIGLTILITVAISVTSIIMTGRYISRP
jgi:hypothetical protein